MKRQLNRICADINVPELEARAGKLRMQIIRMIAAAGSGHCGGSLSAIDILTYLYSCELRVRPEEPHWSERDRFVLSKGHCAPALYAVLADRGFFPEETLGTLRDIGSVLQGHPDMKKTPGVDITSGSLGQGFSCAVGMALAGKIDHRDYRVYVMLGDSEIQTGLLWEAAMFSRHQNLDNLIAIVDNNKLQSDGVTETIVDIEPLAEKWHGFGWELRRIDGHDFRQIHTAFAESKSRNRRPKVIIADTVKGKGVSFMENVVTWHSGAPNPAQTEAAIKELAGEP
jgi:transketolase